ncbi:Positive regulator of purine utilization [Psilocybe cubensis]|uniref:Positive regulator of purine utilization n=2 Tax=Psilocybe cubensis TaxID=181762 RepID=A0ACB8HIX6_PSICU|nr:Positive regulator of purine utilization [Psilocybe cubensis]KAH9487280.1 Positive regulator of purine utilization [Psilocybe cubensis]
MQSTFAIAETDSEREERLNGRKRPRRTVNACVRCKARKQRCDLQEFDHGPCRACRKSNVECLVTEKVKKSAYPDDYVHSLETRVADLESHLQALNPSGGYGNDHWDQSANSTSSSPIASRGWESTTDDGGDEEEQVARGIALLSLHGAAEPHYVGASSGWSWAKTVLGWVTFVDVNSSSLINKRKATPTSGLPCIPSPAVADILIRAVYEHIQARYPFQCWRSFNAWHADRDRYLVEEHKVESDRTAAFFIWSVFLCLYMIKALNFLSGRLMYATGARLLQSTALPGLHAPEVYYAKAMEYLDNIVTLHNLANIQAFLLLAVYSLRCTEGPSVWHLVGIALRLSIELGLHRKASRQARLRDPYTVELRRRIFWSAYGLDRFMALNMGRPLGIQDADIDVELPMDIDFAESDDTALREMSEKELHASTAPSPSEEQFRIAKPITTMTSALHIIKCRQIESEIQRLMYRVDRVETPPEMENEVARILARLDRWKANIPRKIEGLDPPSPPCCTPEWFLWRYYEATLFLLRPLTINADSSDPLLSRCAHAAAGSLEAQRKLHQVPPVSLSLSALHSVFLSGLTLLHCLHLDPRVVTRASANKAIRACSNTLFLYAQHFVAAEPFRDAFEDMANACLDKAEQGDGDSMGMDIAGEGLSARIEKEVSSKLDVDLIDAADDVNDASIPGPLWGKQLGNMSKLMTEDQRENFYALVSSLGFLTPTTDVPTSPNSQTNFCGNSSPLSNVDQDSKRILLSARDSKPSADIRWSHSKSTTSASMFRSATKVLYQAEGPYW